MHPISIRSACRYRPLEPLTHPALLQATATGSQFIALLLVQQRLYQRSLPWWTTITALCWLSSIALLAGEILNWPTIHGPLAVLSLGIGYCALAGARVQAGLAANRPSLCLLVLCGLGASAVYELLQTIHPLVPTGLFLVVIEYCLWRGGYLLLRDRSPSHLGARLTGCAYIAQALVILSYPFSVRYPALADLGVTLISVTTQLQGCGMLLMVLADTERQLQDLNEDLQIEVHERTQALIRAERLAMLGQISAKVAHELKNKLNVINAAVYVLGQEHVARERREQTRNRVEQTVAATAHLVGDLLQLAKPQQSEPGPVDLTEVLEPIIHAVVPATVSVQRQLPDTVPAVLADRQQVEQVLLNVVINAVEAMPQGGNLTISQDCQGDRVRMTIADSGKGIDDGDLPKVFDTFWTTKPEGTGLGLSICRNLIEQQGGSIQLTTGNGPGTQVVIELPAKA